MSYSQIDFGCNYLRNVDQCRNTDVRSMNRIFMMRLLCIMQHLVDMKIFADIFSNEVQNAVLMLMMLVRALNLHQEVQLS